MRQSHSESRLYIGNSPRIIKILDLLEYYAPIMRQSHSESRLCIGNDPRIIKILDLLKYYAPIMRQSHPGSKQHNPAKEKKKEEKRAQG